CYPAAAAPESPTRSLRDALPILQGAGRGDGAEVGSGTGGRAGLEGGERGVVGAQAFFKGGGIEVADGDEGDGFGAIPGVVEVEEDRKSTRLNSSHVKSSYAGFCL